MNKPSSKHCVTKAITLPRRPTHCLFIGLLWFTMLPAAQGQQLLINPGFSLGGGLFGWDVLQERAEWSSRDILGSPLSGSVRGSHLITGNNGSRIVIRQCVAIQQHGDYDFGVWVFAESGQGAGQFGGRAALYAYADSDSCSGTTAFSSFSPAAMEQDEWTLTQGTVEIPEGIQSVLINLAIFKANGVDHDAIVYFDNAFLLPPDQIFADGFE